MITAVCFDLFETLVTEYVADFQPVPSLADLLQIDAIEFARAWAMLTPARFRGELPDFPSALRAVCHHVGRPVAEELIAQLHEDRLAQKARCFASLDNRILEMLGVLHQRGLKLGLISNASIEEVAAWQDGALAPLFDVTTFSYDVGLMKPEPEIYRLTCALLCVEPGATAFIGDGGSDELRGAEQAGLTPYWATWFLDQWPNNRLSHKQEHNKQFIRLTSPSELIAIVSE